MKPTQALLKTFRKLPLTTKDVNKGFYKGNRSGRMGSHTKHGGYIVDYKLVRTYVVPQSIRDGTFDQMSPFVSRRVEPLHGSYTGYTRGPASPELYLERWKGENGLD